MLYRVLLLVCLSGQRCELPRRLALPRVVGEGGQTLEAPYLPLQPVHLLPGFVELLHHIDVHAKSAPVPAAVRILPPLRRVGQYDDDSSGTGVIRDPPLDVAGQAYGVSLLPRLHVELPNPVYGVAGRLYGPAYLLHGGLGLRHALLHGPVHLIHHLVHLLPGEPFDHGGTLSLLFPGGHGAHARSGLMNTMIRLGQGYGPSTRPCRQTYGAGRDPVGDHVDSRHV